MLKRFSILAILSFLAGVLNSLNAQKVNPKEWNNWYFGDKQGVRFDQSPPTILTNSKMSSFENCSTISDSSGDILLYTEGDYVWNNNHNKIGAISDDSIKFQNSSAAGCILLRKPSQDSLYYIFTVPPEEEGYNGFFKYSIINIKANQDTGKIITKDQQLHPVFKNANTSREKIGLVRHESKNAWWIVTKNQNLKFISYLFDKNGIHTPEIKSDFKDTFGGYIAFSPNGKIMATGNRIYQFSPETGKIQRQYGKINNAENSFAGLAFSPNGHFLYFIDTNNQLIQVHIKGKANSNAVYSRKSITDFSENTVLSTLMLAPNGKIYINTSNSQYLSTIHDPNKPGNACNFTLKNLKMPHQSLFHGYGLPTTPSSIFRKNIHFKQKCDTLIFSWAPKFLFDSFYWQYNYGQEDQMIKRSINTFKLPANTTGDDSLKLVYFRTGVTHTINYSFHVKQLQELTGVRKNVKLCPKKSPIKLNGRNGASFYQWSNGSSSQSIKVNEPGIYWVSYSQEMCAKDSFFVKKAKRPNISFSNKDTLCKNDTLKVSLSDQQRDYYINWNTGDTNRAIEIESFGKYIVTVSNDCVTNKKSVNVDNKNCTDCQIHIPNAFSPNHDNLNETFKPFSNCFFSRLEMKIYNRWGERIYFSKKTNASWNGIFKGKKAPVGVYLYQINGKFYEGNNFFKQGEIHLLK